MEIRAIIVEPRQGSTHRVPEGIALVRTPRGQQFSDQPVAKVGTGHGHQQETRRQQEFADPVPPRRGMDDQTA